MVLLLWGGGGLRLFGLRGSGERGGRRGYWVLFCWWKWNDGCFVGCGLMLLAYYLGVLDREGNARKVVNCSCVVVRDWGEESQERSILLNYFQTEQ